MANRIGDVSDISCRMSHNLKKKSVSRCKSVSSIFAGKVVDEIWQQAITAAITSVGLIVFRRILTSCWVTTDDKGGEVHDDVHLVIKITK